MDLPPARRVRVLSVIDSLGAGGAEYSMAQIAPRLPSLGVDLMFVCLKTRAVGPGVEDPSRELNVQYLSGGSPLTLGSQLRRIVRQWGPDLIHTTLFESNILGRVVGSTLRVPVVTSLVNVTYEKVRFADPHIRRWRLRTVQMADAVTGLALTRSFHAISQAVADSAAQHLGIDPKRITVIPRSRDSAQLRMPDDRTPVRSDLGLPGDAIVILNVGRQEYQKGQRHLIDAFSRIADTRRDIFLVVAGRYGHASAELRAARRRSPHRDRIFLLGHRTDIPDLLRSADVFAFPSLYEGLGGALLEAMAVGIPVVASAIDALQEVGGDAVLYANPGDAQDLATKLGLLIADPSLRSELGSAARRRFGEWPTPDEVASRMAAWYTSNAR